MKRFTFRFTRPVLDEQMEEWDREHDSFSCDAETIKEAEKLFDKHCENEFHDETWDYDEIDVTQIDEKELPEPEDPRQLRLFKKGKENPYVQPPLQYDPKTGQLLIQPRARGKAKGHSKRGA